jgi:hypothetical protein
MPHFLRRVRPVTICVRGIDARMQPSPVEPCASTVTRTILPSTAHRIKHTDGRDIRPPRPAARCGCGSDSHGRTMLDAGAGSLKDGDGMPSQIRCLLA